eukprot:s240_g10.t1
MSGEKEPLGMSELGCADGCGRRGCKGIGGKAAGRRSRWGRASSDARTAADGVGAGEWVEMGGEKEPLGMWELGWADGCGQRGCEGGGGNGWEEELLGMRELGCADGGGRGGRKGVGGNKRGEEAAGGRACADGCAQLRMAWAQGSGWKGVGRRSRWG